MAKGATEFQDLTTQAYYIPDLWSPIVLEAYEANLLFTNLVDRRFEKHLKHGDTLNVQDVANLSATAKSENTAVTYETVSVARVQIAVDQFYYAAIAVERVVEVQAMMDQAKLWGPKLAYALALQVDDTLAALVDDFSQNVGTLNAPTSVDNWIRAVQYLDDANVPDEERFAVVAPAEWANIIKQDFFTRQEYKESVGQLSAKAKRGYFGSALGLEFFKSSNVEGANGSGHDNGVFHRQALACLQQLAPEVESQYDIDYLAQKIVSFEMFGVSEMRDTSGVWVKGL
jgi:hypothetical protein